MWRLKILWPTSAIVYIRQIKIAHMHGGAADCHTRAMRRSRSYYDVRIDGCHSLARTHVCKVSRANGISGANEIAKDYLRCQCRSVILRRIAYALS